MNESFSELFEQNQEFTRLKEGNIITAIVIDVTAEHVVLNAGLKSEGMVALNQFRNKSGELEVNIGDQVDVFLENMEDGFGRTKLSREKAKESQVWENLEKAQNDSVTIQGKVLERIKGGFSVDIEGIRGFLPGSLVDVRPLRDTSHIEGQELEFKIVKIDRKRNNVVVSRKAALEEENSEEREALLASLSEGQAVKGIVKNLTDYGAFIDLGGVDGLLHITDMAWRRIKKPSEIVNIGDEIELMVLKYDREKKRVSLGLKQLGDDPWEEVGIRNPIGTKILGTVTNITDYGCFVQIEENVEGLVHVSEMDWTNKNLHPSKKVTVGQEVEVCVLDIDESRRRVSLGMKQCLPNPWESFSEQHEVGSRIEGVIKSITDFGIFIGLTGDIDGLLHLSDISWTVPGEEAVRNFNKGDSVETAILAIDPERERISLGIKQLDKDPVMDYTEANKKGTIVSGTVIEVDARGATINLAESVEGYLRAADIARDRVEDARTVLSVGETVEAKIVGMERKNRVIMLSIKQKDSDIEDEAVQEYSKSTKTQGAVTLGDLIKDQIDS